SNSIFAELRWLDVYSLVDIRKEREFGCPSRPIHLSSLYFGTEILNAAGIEDELGRPSFTFVLEDEAKLSPNRVTELKHRDAPPLRQMPEPYIEDITRAASAIPRLPTDRVYRIVYPSKDSMPSVSIEVSCGGNPTAHSGRSCFTPIHY